MAKLFSSGSRRSLRVIVSPVARRNAVTAGGPPIAANNRLAAVLSLVINVARHRSRTVRSLPTWRRVTGACSRRSWVRTGRRRSSSAASRSACLSTVAASTLLKVLHSGKRSSWRWPRRRPPALSSRVTPSRPLHAFSSAAKSAAAAMAASTGVAGTVAGAAARASSGNARVDATAALLNCRNRRRASMWNPRGSCPDY
ncbi:hypothetical protein D3C75_957160 [compost metagenome]